MAQEERSQGEPGQKLLDVELRKEASRLMDRLKIGLTYTPEFGAAFATEYLDTLSDIRQLM